MFHHLMADAKAKALREVRRVLKVGGTFHLLDFRAPEGGVHGLLQRLFNAPDGQRANDRLDAMLTDAGFVEIEERAEQHVLFQPVVSFHAVVPA